MSKNILKEYKKSTKSKLVFVFIVSFSLIAMMFISVSTGPVKLSFRELLGLFNGTADDFVKQIVYNIRLPRVVAAVLTGTALSISGAVIQSLLRNPLASPFTLGISSASAFGAAFAIIVLGAGGAYAGSGDIASVNNPYLLTASAFLWSLLGVAVILMLSKYKGAGPEVIILAGIVISSLFGAGISAMQYFADNVQLAAIVFWTFGDFGRANWDNISVLAAILIPVIVYFMFQIWNYKALQSGDEYAVSMGVNVSAIRLTGMTVASLATAVAVSFYGIIAFVGLVVPHIVRRIIGGDEQFLIPASALFGAFFLLASDTLARTIISPVILPVGILTSFIGAPLFLFLLIKGMGKNYWS